MTEREVKQLIKLMGKFLKVKDKEGKELPDHARDILRCVAQWIVWHGRDEIGMNL